MKKLIKYTVYSIITILLIADLVSIIYLLYALYYSIWNDIISDTTIRLCGTSGITLFLSVILIPILYGIENEFNN